MQRREEYSEQVAERLCRNAPDFFRAIADAIERMETAAGGDVRVAIHGEVKHRYADLAATRVVTV